MTDRYQDATNDKDEQQQFTVRDGEDSLPASEEGRLVGPMFLGAVALALCLGGSWGWGLLTIVLALLLAVSNYSAKVEQVEQQEIRFNMMHPGAIFKEMLRWESKYLFSFENNKEEQNDDDHTGLSSAQDRPKLLQEGKSIVLAGIRAQIQKLKKPKRDKDSNEAVEDNMAALIGQESVYLAFRRFAGRDNEVVMAAFSLLALIAKNSKVREKSLYEADTFGLDIPMRVIRNALERAKHIDNDDERELNAAELQRKGFLCLGALADGCDELALLVVQEGGVDAALDAIDWFRCHADVVNWALWALFIFCYEQPSNKIAVLQCQGMPKIIEAMRHCSASVDVARHGMALLFDLLREDTAHCHPNNSAPIDIWRIRQSATTAGLHEVVLTILDQHSEASDVTMMGMELLAGTGYSKTLQ